MDPLKRGVAYAAIVVGLFVCGVFLLPYIYQPRVLVYDLFGVDGRTKILRIDNQDNSLTLLNWDEARLNEFLEYLDFWNKKRAQQNNAKEIIRSSVDNLEIIITPKRQKWMAIYSGKTDSIFSTFDFLVSKSGSGQLFINFDKSAYTDGDDFNYYANLSVKQALVAIIDWEGYSSHSEELDKYLTHSLNSPNILELRP